MAWVCPWALVLWYVAKITLLLGLGTQDICATFYLSFLYMIVYWNLRFSAVMMFSSASSLTVFVIINTEIYFCRASQQVAFQTPPSSGISLAHL